MTANLNIIIPERKLRKPVKPKHPALPLRLMQLAFGSLGRVFPRLFSNIALKFFSTPRKKARHKVSDKILEQAQISDILIGGNMLKVYEWGKGNKTVLLVHGWESRGTGLRSFVPNLVKAGYRVVAFDAPGHGDSGGTRLYLKDYGNAVSAIYHKYGNVEGIICHSFGGAGVAYAMSQTDPKMSIKSLVLVGVPSAISYPVYNALRTMNAPPAVRKYFIEGLEKLAGVEIEKMTFEKLNKKMKVERTLVVHDKQDEQVKFEEAENIVKHWENAKLQVTDGFGHFRLIKSKQVVERVADFIINPT